MKKKNLKILIVAAVLVLTAAAAVLHLSTRNAVPEGYLQLIYSGEEKNISLSDLDLYQVQGTISNAKGDQKTIDAKGISVSDVLQLAGVEKFSVLTVTGDDEYSAELTAEEAKDATNTYFILQEDGGIQLIVFHDTNSKRCVSDVVRVEAV